MKRSAERWSDAASCGGCKLDIWWPAERAAVEFRTVVVAQRRAWSVTITFRGQWPDSGRCHIRPGVPSRVSFGRGGTVTRLYEAERILNEIGVRFDAGYGRWLGVTGNSTGQLKGPAERAFSAPDAQTIERRISRTDVTGGLVRERMSDCTARRPRCIDLLQASEARVIEGD